MGAGEYIYQPHRTIQYDNWHAYLGGDFGRNERVLLECPVPIVKGSLVQAIGIYQMLS